MELTSRYLLGIISTFLLLVSFSIVSPETDMKSSLNYIVTGDLPDGEHEVRMRFGDTVFREASITENSVNRKHKWALMLRQLAVGPDFLQLIYKVNSRNSMKKIRLVECEIINDWNSADEFRKKFYRQLERAGVNIPSIPQISHSGNEHEHDEDYNDVDDDDVDDLDSINNNNDNLDLSNLESNWEDLEFDPEAKEPIHKDSIDLSEGLLDLRNVTVRIVREDEIDVDLKSALDVTLQKKLCRRLHRKLKREIEHHRQVVERVTNNSRCGMGYTALEAKDLGGYMGADKCCRFHDLGCPFYIEAFTEKFGLYNYRFYTIMHCACDERFRSCLKQTNTGAADFVGKLFFNIVQTKCFVLKPEAVCTKRSWWGKCLKTEYKKQAHLREPLPY